MKTNYIFQTLVMLFFVLTANAQQGINYKAIINDANGDAIVNTEVTILFTILENGTTEVYKETHNPTTDANGIVIVNIGEGAVVSGVFNDIDWGGNPHFLNTQINTGSGLTDMGTTEFKAVPYALHSKTAGNAINTAGLNPGDLLMFDGNAFVPATFHFYYRDNDLDEYGDESAFVFSPVKPDGFALIGRDCDDSNENVNPEIEEICDGIDNNCDGEIDEGCDLDQDGYSVSDGDCDDENPNVNPGEIEICSDEIDNDCDGEIDEGCDLDQDGYSVNEGDCDDLNPNINPGAQEICDDVDNDCDGQTDEELELVTYYPDNDGDGYGYTNYGWRTCSGPPWESYSLIGEDCDDNDASIYPGAIELCDGKDNDCDGQVDNNPPLEIVDNNFGSCSTAELLGEVCGDDFCDQLHITGIGEGWYKVLLVDCTNNLGISDLKFEANLNTPQYVDYDLYLYSSCGVLIDQSSGSDDVVSYELPDIPLSDESQYLYMEIRWVSGSSCQNWSLYPKGGDCDY